MTGINRKSLLGLIIAATIVAFSLSPQFRSVYQLPEHLRINEGETTVFNVGFPMTMTIDQDQAIKVDPSSSYYNLSRPVSLEPINRGKAVIEFKLFGIIPVRTVEVDVLPTLRLVPGGHSIGVVLHSQGVIVVGYSPVKTDNGQYVNPAKDAGMQVGDVIISINGQLVQSDNQVAEIINASGKEGRPADIIFKRDGTQDQVSLSPVLCTETNRYRIGLFVRDSAAGVGTLTFYDPHSHVYGALGHIITDSDTNQPFDCDKGKIVLATVSGIQQGRSGQPGEKIGVFIDEDQTLGTISKNSQFGIFGELNTPLNNRLYPEPLPVASMSQVQLGPAQILTVIDGQAIESFDIEIQKINLQEFPEGKGLVIKVTDPRLLKKTGGIVQGMSGSPIIQNGKIIGAVTHVFVHDPTKGYGCFIDWMLMDGGLVTPKQKETFSDLFTLLPEYHKKVA